MEKETSASFVFRALCICCMKTSKKQQRKMFLGQEIEVTQSIEPDEILWENLSFAKGSTENRKIIMYFVGLGVILLSTISAIVLDAMTMQ